MGPVIWFIGLSGSGKTTLALKTREFLEKHPNIYPDVSHWEIIDGDIVRGFLESEIGYNFEDRRKSVIIMGLLAYYLSKNNNIGVIVANISPFHDIRQKFRKEIPRYTEIFCQCTISACMSRDPKGHYKNQCRNGIKNFIGLDIPFQVPENPHLILNTESNTIDQCMVLISNFFYELEQ
ncbi:MAG: hypothetical protein CVV30_03005 [Methanomicrobiales archaeon HGW-Methanomicrobiales-1]|jgi:adenylylsulfate kinase|nr:MAG: hypothetical protein CVV30_03005 [Methanomicrobiales archaeon HGW-Methanomicrobiales-1]